MKNKSLYIIFLLSILLFSIFLNSCAKRGTITGGPKDTIAPKITISYPKNHSTNFSQKEIKIYFNELIKIKDINKQLIISPPLEKNPIIIPQGSSSKFISIKLQEELKPNTTYSFNFGQSITDNNEGNPYSQFKYILSTGQYIDSLILAGRIKDAYLQKPDNFVSIQLYDAKTFNDSTIYKEKPLYVTNTLDSLHLFSLENLKAGDYKIIALKDKNNNYKYDPKSDKIGFIEETISLPVENTAYELELFKENLIFKAEKPTQQSNNKFFLGYEGNPEDIKIITKRNGEEFPTKITKFLEGKKDTLQLFLPYFNEKDSIEFNVSKGNFSKKFYTKIKTLKTSDSLKIVPNKNFLSFRDPLILKTKTPLEKISKDKIQILNKDSINVDFELEYNLYEGIISFHFKKNEKETYHLNILPKAFEDFYKTTNDTLKFSFPTKSFSDYGNLKINLKNVNRFPIIVEILSDKGEVIANKTLIDLQPILFEYIDPQVYTVRLIYDENKNNKWDTGNYLEKKQPEQVFYFNNKIDVRANWDVEQELIIE